MNKVLKVALFSAAAAGAALLGWRFVRAGAPQLPEGRDPASNGDFEVKGAGEAGDLTKAQREQLLEELEAQLGA